MSTWKVCINIFLFVDLIFSLRYIIQGKCGICRKGFNYQRGKCVRDFNYHDVKEYYYEDDGHCNCHFEDDHTVEEVVPVHHSHDVVVEDVAPHHPHDELVIEEVTPHGPRHHHHHRHHRDAEIIGIEDLLFK